jgi:hypothetical protein
VDLPHIITNSGLYERLTNDPELLNAILSLRLKANSLAETVSRTVPAFTDHTIRHMDALWGVSDCILTSSELATLTNAEAFLLTCGFYLHDIGMAYAATEEGLARIRSAPAYTSFIASTMATAQGDSTLEARAVAHAVRSIHANAASELATRPIPGTDVYLFDNRSVREQWAETCGRIAASHHWSLEMVERELGSQGVIPLPGGRRGDLGYVASLLRVTDYAHINRDRALAIDREFRPTIQRESLIHWLAQEHIDGPARDGADLVYRASVPIADVDAWWLYYEMLKALDAEIRAVRRYLDRRASSQGRFSLQGVRGATSPEEVAVFVPTTGFLPIEINLRTGSIERLVQLLAGESLYGPDPMAAVRELIQNACDAVMLKAAIASTDFDKAALSIPIRVALKTMGSTPLLEVTDSGVGMTRKVMTDYLISIASDYWTSQFHIDFPGARGRGFQPAGKFGIGFLSTFMLGEEVMVESNRDGEERYRLQLKGVGRRGEIRSEPSPSGSGTAVRVTLRDSVVESLRPLSELVRIYAPMLPHALEVDVDGQITVIPVGWLKQLDAGEFHKWTLQAVTMLLRNRADRGRTDVPSDWRHIRSRFLQPWAWSGERSNSWPKGWPEYQKAHVRLLASFEGYTLLSLRGLAIQPIATPGYVGVIDLESASPDVSRQQLLSTDVTDILRHANEKTRPLIVKNLNAFAEEGLLIDRLDFLATCVNAYGRKTILEASVPWINLLKLPGEVRLISSAALLEKLTKAVSLFIAFGTGPWTAMRRWVALGSQSVNTEPAIVLDDLPQDHLSYHSGSEERVGKLCDLWTDCKDAPLFGTILRLAAEAWQVSLNDLTKEDGWHHNGSVLCGRLERP